MVCWRQADLVPSMASQGRLRDHTRVLPEVLNAPAAGILILP